MNQRYTEQVYWITIYSMAEFQFVRANLLCLTSLQKSTFFSHASDVRDAILRGVVYLRNEKTNEKTKAILIDDLPRTNIAPNMKTIGRPPSSADCMVFSDNRS